MISGSIVALLVMVQVNLATAQDVEPERVDTTDLVQQRIIGLSRQQPGKCFTCHSGYGKTKLNSLELIRNQTKEICDAVVNLRMPTVEDFQISQWDEEDRVLFTHWCNENH